MLVWVNGSLVQDGAPAVSPLDHGLTVGDGVFETMRVVDGVPFAPTRHLDRLEASAGGLGLPAPPRRQVVDAMATVTAAARERGDPAHGSGRLRVTWTGGPAPLGSERGSGPGTLIAALAPLGAVAPTATLLPQHLPRHFSAWVRNERSPLAGLKTTSYADNVVALAAARRAGAQEAVLANTAGMLCEGTGSNIVLEVDGRLVTPTLASGCLAGVTRALALLWCDIEERDVPLEVLRRSREVALVSTTRNLQPVLSVDGTPVGDGGPGPLTTTARALFAAALERSTDP